MTQKFIAGIENWTARQKRNTDFIFRQSAQDVMEEARRLFDYPEGDAREPPAGAKKGGRMPYKTGALWNSGFAESASGGRVDGDYVIGIAKAGHGETLTLGFSVKHALVMEYGSPARNIEGFGFMRNALADWPSIVSANARRVI